MKNPESFNQNDETKDETVKDETVFISPELSPEEIKKKIEELKKPTTPEEEEKDQKLIDRVWEKLAPELGFDPNFRGTEEEKKKYAEQGKRLVEEEKKREIAGLKRLLKKLKEKPTDPYKS